jgi:hypothetical protein
MRSAVAWGSKTSLSRGSHDTAHQRVDRGPAGYLNRRRAAMDHRVEARMRFATRRDFPSASSGTRRGGVDLLSSKRHDKTRLARLTDQTDMDKKGDDNRTIPQRAMSARRQLVS